MQCTHALGHPDWVGSLRTTRYATNRSFTNHAFQLLILAVCFLTTERMLLVQYRKACCIGRVLSRVSVPLHFLCMLYLATRGSKNGFGCVCVCVSECAHIMHCRLLLLSVIKLTIAGRECLVEGATSTANSGYSIPWIGMTCPSFVKNPCPVAAIGCQNDGTIPLLTKTPVSKGNSPTPCG